MKFLELPSRTTPAEALDLILGGFVLEAEQHPHSAGQGNHTEYARFDILGWRPLLTGRWPWLAVAKSGLLALLSRVHI